MKDGAGEVRCDGVGMCFLKLLWERARKAGGGGAEYKSASGFNPRVLFRMKPPKHKTRSDAACKNNKHAYHSTPRSMPNCLPGEAGGRGGRGGGHVSGNAAAAFSSLGDTTVSVKHVALCSDRILFFSFFEIFFVVLKFNTSQGEGRRMGVG